jgi:cyclopropane fatty-acyl-phospholipid synthase-like methyltransferase
MKNGKTMWTGWLARTAFLHFNSARREHRDAAFLEGVLAEIRGDEHVLDLGAGTGFLTLALAARLNAGSVIALDLSRDMIDELLRKAREKQLESVVEVRCTDGVGTGLSDGSIDLVVSIGVLHEVPSPVADCEL